MPLVYLLLRAILPPWGDRLVDIAEDITADWSAVAAAARDGWQDSDEAGIADAVAKTIAAIPDPPGARPDDARKLGDAAAVLTRWIAHAPRKTSRVKWPGLRRRKMDDMDLAALAGRR
jgi:hypothetical protein